MKCKSCNTIIRKADKFCPNCGGLIVRERLSMKGTWYEFIGPFFSWDNNFWKTFKDLLVNPKKVLNTYISGARKKYFKPFPFLIVFATIALFFYKFFPESNFSDPAEAFNEGYTSSSGKVNTNYQITQFINNLKEFIKNYYNFVIILSIPLMSFMTFLIFRKHRNNFAEHLVFQSYIQSIIGYLTIFSQVIVLQLLDLSYAVHQITYIAIIIIYGNYVYTRFYSLNFKSIVIANLKFVALLIVFIVLFVILMGFFLRQQYIIDKING